MKTGRIALRRIDDFVKILDPPPDETRLIVSASKAICRVQRNQKTSTIQNILEKFHWFNSSFARERFSSGFLRISTWFGSVSFSSNQVLIHDSFAKTTETIEFSAPNDPIQQVVSTHLHVAILMKTGRIALRRIDDFERTPTILEPPPDETTLIVSTSKEIYRVQRDQKTSKIQKILEDSEGISEDVKHEVVGFPWPVRIVDAKGGHDFLMFLDSTGNLFSMGTGTRGELGVGLIRHVAEPVHIEQLAGIPIKKIACGGWHTVALTTGGDVYVWGWNRNGQLGRYKAATEMYPVLFEEFPENIEEEEPVVQDIEVTEHTTTVYINDQKFMIGNDFVDITEFGLK